MILLKASIYLYMKSDVRFCLFNFFPYRMCISDHKLADRRLWKTKVAFDLTMLSWKAWKEQLWIGFFLLCSVINYAFCVLVYYEYIINCRHRDKVFCRVLILCLFYWNSALVWFRSRKYCFSSAMNSIFETHEMKLSI